MAALVEIDDRLARAATMSAQQTGRSLAQSVEEAIARDLRIPIAPLHGRPAGRPVVVPTFGGDGIVDGLTLAEAVDRADLDADAVVASGGGRADANG